MCSCSFLPFKHVKKFMRNVCRVKIIRGILSQNFVVKMTTNKKNQEGKK